MLRNRGHLAYDYITGMSESEKVETIEEKRSRAGRDGARSANAMRTAQERKDLALKAIRARWERPGARARHGDAIRAASRRRKERVKVE